MEAHYYCIATEELHYGDANRASDDSDPSGEVFGITSNTLAFSSQSPSGPAGGAPNNYGLERGAARIMHFIFPPIFHYFPTTGLFFPNPTHIFPRSLRNPKPYTLYPIPYTLT